MTPAEVFHPSVFIIDEMDARGWTRDDLATRMVGEAATKDEWGLARTGLDIYFAVHDRCVVIGESTVQQLTNAFGISEEFFRNLERAWIEHPSSAIPSLAPDVRLVRASEERRAAAKTET